MQALLDEIADPGGLNAPASARAVKLLLSKMFNFALPREFAFDFNPVLGPLSLLITSGPIFETRPQSCRNLERDDHVPSQRRPLYRSTGQTGRPAAGGVRFTRSRMTRRRAGSMRHERARARSRRACRRADRALCRATFVSVVEAADVRNREDRPILGRANRP